MGGGGTGGSANFGVTIWMIGDERRDVFLSVWWRIGKCFEVSAGSEIGDDRVCCTEV